MRQSSAFLIRDKTGKGRDDAWEVTKVYYKLLYTHRRLVLTNRIDIVWAINHVSLYNSLEVLNFIKELSVNLRLCFDENKRFLHN